MSAITPRHTHDCAHCRFVGRFEKLDLYTCKGAHGTTYIARFGIDGKYYSGEDFENRISKVVRSEISGRSESQHALLVAFRVIPCAFINIARLT